MMENSLKINIEENIYIILKIGQNMMENGKIINGFYIYEYNTGNKYEGDYKYNVKEGYGKYYYENEIDMKDNI